jgi:hypothetical protein
VIFPKIAIRNEAPPNVIGSLNALKLLPLKFVIEG